MCRFNGLLTTFLIVFDCFCMFLGVIKICVIYRDLKVGNFLSIIVFFGLCWLMVNGPLYLT